MHTHTHAHTVCALGMGSTVQVTKTRLWILPAGLGIASAVLDPLTILSNHPFPLPQSRRLAQLTQALFPVTSLGSPAEARGAAGAAV